MTEIDTSREAVESLVSLLRHNSAWENLQEIDTIAHAEAIAILPALLARVEKAEASCRGFQKNGSDTWTAMLAMRDAINEYIPLPSVESDLLQGPENHVFCAVLAENIIRRVQELEAALDEAWNAAIEAAVNAVNGCDRISEAQPAIRALKKGSTND